MMGIEFVPCSKCRPCLINKARTWQGRLMLENEKHVHSGFVTLTYDNEHLPPDGSLCPEHCQAFFKKLRKFVAPEKIRFYLVGEYGKLTDRPHYHAIVFGLHPLLGREWVDASWTDSDGSKRGRTNVGSVTPRSTAYVAGYVTEKLVGRDRSDGKFPEFARMSLRPGIGATAMVDVARAIESYDGGLDFVADSGDVPTALLREMRWLLLGRYLRGKLREGLGFSSKDTPAQTRAEYLRRVRQEAEALTSLASRTRSSRRKIMLDIHAQESINCVKRYDIFKSGRKI